MAVSGMAVSGVAVSGVAVSGGAVSGVARAVRDEVEAADAICRSR